MKQVTPTFSKPQSYIITTTQQINLFLAGVGSGKTHLGGFLSGYLLYNFPKVFGFIGANTYEQLSTSTLYRIREVWHELFGWVEDIDYVVGKKPPKSFNTEHHNFDSYNGIISFRWGAIAFKGSLDNAKAHDGKEFGWAILDETKDSRETDIKETILTRLRKPGIYINNKTGQLVKQQYTEGIKNKAFNPLYILTSPASVKWLNDWFKLDNFKTEIETLIYDKRNFFKKEYEDKCVVISSTYHNIGNLPEGYIAKMMSNLTVDKANKLIYGNPFVKTGGEFYSSFKSTKHIQEVEFNPKLPIHIAFDQNVVPYITMTLYQVEKVYNNITRADITEVRQFDEICLPNPRNKTNKLCLEFIKRWGRYCRNGLFYYGDPSGRKSDTRTLEHDYKIVEKLLRKYLNNNSDRVPYKHPPVLKRKDFINDVFDELYNIRIIIDPKCKKSIADFTEVKEDHNGKKSKKKVKDPATGIYYEPYGHTSDSFDYFMCEIFKRIFMKYYK